jgi:hypothetical protein
MHGRHSRRRPVITSGQSCARMKGSTSDKFIVMRRGLRGGCAVDLSGQHLQRRDGRPCAQSKKSIKLPVWSVRRVCLSCYDVSEAVSALARRWCQANAPSLCRLCEVKPPFSVTPPTSTTHTPSPPTARISASASSTSTAPSALIRVL